MQDYVEAMINWNEREEMEAAFYDEHGLTYDEYLKNWEAEYEDSKNER